MARDEEPRTTYHPPAGGTEATAEPREETVERAVRESHEAQRIAGAPHPEKDPSSRRGLTDVLRRNLPRNFAFGFLGGAVLAVILRLTLPEPVTGAPGRWLGGEPVNWIAWIVVLGLAVGIVTMVLSSYFFLAREDGRVEREVERKTGREPEGPGRPLDPDYDVKD